MLEIICIGDMSTAVFKLQKALNTEGATLQADGRFGPKTERAVMDYQKKNRLTANGIVDVNMIQMLHLDLRPTVLSDLDFDYAASRLACEMAVIKAFTMVEAPGGGFDAYGRPVILYERHYFYRLYLDYGPKGYSVEQLTAKRKALMEQGGRDICWPSPLTFAKVDQQGRAIAAYDRYGPSSLQYERLERARTYSDTAALMSCSWGRFQVMGQYAVNLGWTSVQAFHRAMQASERDHLDAFIAYCLDRQGKVEGKMVRLTDALQAKQWRDIAALYNGPGAIETYAPKLKASYDKLR